MARQGIFFPLKDAALREDVHQLGELVGEVIREQGGDSLFAAVEGDRQAAIARRQGDPDGAVQLVVRTRDRPATEARELVRSFSTWFQMVNMAEKVHRIRRRRQYLSDSASPQPSGIEDTLRRLKSRGVTLDAIRTLLDAIEIEPVFAAHPNESTRRTILRKQQRIADLLVGRLGMAMTPAEARTMRERVRTEITSGWQTADNSRERLSVADEREHVLFFIAEVLYPVLPVFYEEIEAALATLYGDPGSEFAVPDMIRFGSWVGGDMDGSPDVHAKTVRETLARHHALIVNRYFIECQELAEKLSQSAARIGVSERIQARIEAYSIRLPGSHVRTPSSHDRMPYRVFLGQIAERLRATYDGRQNQYENAAELLADVELIAASLEQNRGRHAGLFAVRRFMRRIRSFGFHLATLDIRQSALVHRAIVSHALAAEDWLRASAAERRQRLAAALERDEGPTQTLDAAGKRTLWVLESICHGRHRYGERAVGPYVISKTTGADDVLSVLLLARWADLADRETSQVPIDIAPLFEGEAALERIGEVLDELLDTDVYRRHLDRRGNRQIVMIGYSESNRETGVVASRWLLHRAQQRLVETMQRHGVEFTIFHGRGGAASRGGGRTSAIVESAPRGAVSGRMRWTEQGEAVNEKYGLELIALRTFEQAFHALTLMQAGALEQQNPAAKWCEAMALAASESRRRYRATVFEDPNFHAFFRQVTPIDVIERMQIGSRPTASEEGAPAGIASMRAIPWNFAWSQSRYLLPGWFGAGTALDAITREYGEDLVSTMYARWRFFEALVDDIELMLAKVDLGIAEFYDGLVESGLAGFCEDLRAEYELARTHIQRLKGCARLLDAEPTLQRSIRLRNPYVDPIHLMQVDLLARWRSGDRSEPELYDALVASVNGIAQGMQGSV
jgi:phosphoenolpyruvate carboxylase